MAIDIASDEAVRVLEEAVRQSRDPEQTVSSLWLDRIAQLEEWRLNKVALTAFATAVLAKATEPDVNPLSLIDRSGDPHSYSARTFAREVLVPNAVRLGLLLGTPGPDPLAGSPWFGPERIDQIDKWKPSARKHADDLVGWLASLTPEGAREALVAFALKRAEAYQQKIDERREALSAEESDLPADELAQALDRFITRNPEDGRRGAALAAAVFSAAGHSVVARPVNDPGQVDIDVLDAEGLLAIGIEVKQKPATEQDAIDIVAGALAQGGTRAVLCAFAQGADRLLDGQFVLDIETEYGVFLEIVYSAGDMIRLAAFTCGRTRNAILRDIPRHFLERLAELDCSPDALAQWRGLLANWGQQQL
jgi:hypothetical protein